MTPESTPITPNREQVGSTALFGLMGRMKDYIEQTEEYIDGEWGSCRTAEELIRKGKMPKLYNEVIAAISEANK